VNARVRIGIVVTIALAHLLCSFWYECIYPHEARCVKSFAFDWSLGEIVIHP